MPSSTGRQRWTSRIDRTGLLLLCFLVSAVYVQAYRLHPAHPHIGGDGGWWNWFDQGWYLKSAKGWAFGDLDPSQHFYLPGYALLGAPFVPLLSVHAFGAVDLSCLLVSLLLFSRIATRLLPSSVPHAALVGASVYAVTTLGSPTLRDVWVAPWSSSGATPFIYAALLAALWSMEAPDRPGRVFLVGLAGGAIAAFRPSDAMPVWLACALWLGVVLLRQPRRYPQSWLRIAASIGAGLLGLAISLGLLSAAYLAIYGLHESDYVQLAGAIGFEWRSLAVRWVTLGLDPRPLYEGRGLVAAFPWLPLSLAIFPAYLLLFVRSPRWLAHGLIITASSLHMVIYLTFRDLYPEGLYRHGNYHYYKWVLPVCSLYCVIMCCDLVLMSARERVRAALIVTIGLCLLLPWRVRFTDLRPIQREATADPSHTLAFESGLTSLNDAVLGTADASWEALYTGRSTLTIAGNIYTERLDYKIHPATGGFFVTPLRRLPAGHATLTLDPGVTLDPTAPLLHAKVALAFGRPCWLPTTSRACTPETPIVPPALGPEGEIPLDRAGQAFLSGAWSFPEPDGRWTDGDTAFIRVRPPAAGALQLAMNLSAFVPAGSDPLKAAVAVESQVIAQRDFRDGLPTQWSVEIPAVLAAEPQALLVTITIFNPRRPTDIYPRSTDFRRLGLFFRSLRLTPVRAAS